MSRNCIVSPTASQDLAAILDDFFERNVEAGDIFVNKFEQKCRYLAQFPMMGQRYSTIFPELRGIPLDSYVIFYQVTDECIEIVRVVSGYQDFRALFSDVSKVKTGKRSSAMS